MAKATKTEEVREGFTRFTIDLPTSVVIESRGGRAVADVSQLSPEIIARLAEHGLEQKAGDSASGCMKEAGFDGLKRADLDADQSAKVVAVVNKNMADTLNSLYEGVWAERREGAGPAVDPTTAARRVVLRSDVEKAFGKETWKAMEVANQNAALDGVYPTLDADDQAKVDEAVAARIAALDAARAAKAKLGGIKVSVKR